MTRYHYPIQLPVKFNNWLTEDHFQDWDPTLTRELIIHPSEIVRTNWAFVRWLNSLGLTVETVRVFRSTPSEHYHLHKDLAPSEVKAKIKLNMIYDSYGSTMSWYHQRSGTAPRLWTNYSGVQSQYYRPEDCEEVYTTDCDTDCLINGHEIHTLKNTDNHGQHRLCYSLVVQNKDLDLTWTSAVEIFQPWLK